MAAIVKGNPQVTLKSNRHKAPAKAQPVINKMAFRGCLRPGHWGDENSVKATSSGGAMQNLLSIPNAKAAITANIIILLSKDHHLA